MNNAKIKSICYSNNETSSIQPPIPLWLAKLPNRLTFLRIFCIPVVVYLMTFGDIADETWRFWDVKPILPSATDILAAIVFAIAAITDFFDGMIARKFNIETMLGKLLDPLADKLLVVSALIILVEKHRMEGWIAVILIVRDLGINAIRLSAIDEGIQIPSNAIGKTKTAFLDIGIVGLIVYGFIWKIPFHYIGHIFIALALAVSILSALQYLKDYAHQLKLKTQKAT
jgi:CDP-diacylglycerol--glycerol-3-phosphate 3-phosphatidyltransferase